MEEWSLKEYINRNEIDKKVSELAIEITHDYEGQDLVVIGVLKGGFIFLADLVKKIKIPIEIDFMGVTSYGADTKSSGIVKITKDTDVNILNKHVLIVEDIVDTGLTLKYLKELLCIRSPSSIKICTIFDKPAKRIVDIDIDYKGITIDDVFVVGYGLDYAEKYRNLPDLYILDNNIGV